MEKNPFLQAGALSTDLGGKHRSVSFFSIEKHETTVSRWARARTRAAKVGIGLSKDKNAQKLAVQCWLEAIDPLHRHGHSLHLYYSIWLHSESTQPFFYWLDVGNVKEPRYRLLQQCIKYLGPKGREPVDANVQAPFDFAKRLSGKWSTGAGPRIGCVRDYPVEPSALPGGGEIEGPIALSSSEFASTNNEAQRVGQDKSSSAASNSKKKRTREQEDREEINTIITLDDLRQHYGRKRKDVAESLGVSVSTLKRTCRQYGIKRWPNIIRKKDERPPDQHGENNPSPTCKTLSTKGQTEMENEIVEGPNAGRPPDQHGENNPSPTCKTLSTKEQTEMENEIVEGPNEAGVSSECEFHLKNQWSQFSVYPNLDGPMVPHPHITSTQILGENMGSSGDWRNLFASLEEPLLQLHVSGSMWTVPPCLDQAPSRLMPAIAHTTGSSDDLRNLLPLVEEPFSAGHVSRSIDWTIPPCSVPAPSQPMPTIAHTTGSSDDLRNFLPMVEDPFSAGHVSGRAFFGRPCLWNEEAGVSSECEFQLKNQWSQFSAYPNSDGPVDPHPHITSTQILGENMGSLGDRRNLFASLEEPLLQMHVSGSMWTVPPCLDQAPSRLMPTIAHTTIAHTTGSSDDLRNLLPLVEEPFLAGHVSGSIDWTIPPCSVPAPSQPMPTIAHTTGSSDNLRNLLPMVEEPFSAGHVSGSIDWTVPQCSVPAPSQPMPTIAHTTGSSDDLRNLPMVEEPFLAGHVSGSIEWTVPLCSVPAPSQPMPTIAHTMGNSDDLRNLKALVEEPFPAKQAFGSVSGTGPSCSDPALSQLMPTIPHTMPTIPRMMPLLTERQDTRSVKLKATYGDTTIKFNLPLTSGISELNK